MIWLSHHRNEACAILIALVCVRCSACEAQATHPEAIKHHDMGIQYLNEGQCVTAEERCRLAMEYGSNFEHPHNCLGMVELLCHANLDKAAQHFKDALAINQDFAEAHNNLGTTFFRRSPPKYNAACDEFKAALEIDPGFLNARENYGVCLMRKGTIEGSKGKTDKRKTLYKKARSHLIRLLEMDPNNFNGRHHLGFMDFVEGEYAAAEQNFKRCLEIDPENPVCCYNLGNTYLKTARCDDAIQAYVCAMREGKASEVSVGARQNLGVAYELCAKKDAAIQSFLEQIKQDPGNATHHYDLGTIYRDKGLMDQAINEWENTIKLDPKHCPAYFELAMHANRLLDTGKTIRRCTDFIACRTDKDKGSGAGQSSERVARCKDLVKKLQLE